MFSTKIILDSITPHSKRLTTIELCYPRFIHAEVLTHRDRARNSASSRAIPWKKMSDGVALSPVIPEQWGAEKKGMQTGEALSYEDSCKAEEIWLKARSNALASGDALHKLGVHKSLCNRLLEPFAWMTVVMSATEWNNFFRLRCHPDAEYHFQKIANMIKQSIADSVPCLRPVGDYHRPYLSPNDYEWSKTQADPREMLNRISVARCARVSYTTQDKESRPEEDLELFSRLKQGSGFGHWSPMEHVARAAHGYERSGPYVGWVQYRKSFTDECAIG